MAVRYYHPWLVAVLALLLAAWLGGRSLNADAIWFDEYYSIFESGGTPDGPLSPLELTFRVASYSVWPPAYNFVLAAWSAFVGWSPIAGRVLSWLLGLLSIAVIYRLARQFSPVNSKIPVTVAILMGSSAFYLYYLHELRGYTFHVLLGCSAAVLYWELLKHDAHRVSRLLFLISLIFLLYSHPVGQVWFAVLVSYHVLFERQNVRWQYILFLFFVAAVFYFPWIVIMVKRVEQEIASPRGLDLALMLGAAASAYTNWLAIIVAGLCALTLRRIRERPVIFLWFWLIGVIALVLLVDRLVPFLFHIRLLLAVLPAVILLTAMGLAELQSISWLPVMISALWILMGVYLSTNAAFMRDLPGAWPTISWPGFERAMKTLNQHANAEDAVLFRLADADMENWLNPSLQYYFYGSPLHISLLSLVNEHNPIPFNQRLDNFINGAPRVWVAALPEITPDEQTAALDEALSGSYSHCPAAVEMTDMHIDVYARGTVAACPSLSDN